MVLVLGIFDDEEMRMRWLDSSYPPDKDPSIPGIGRGDCSLTEDPYESQHKQDAVIFSNLRIGPFGSTYTDS